MNNGSELIVLERISYKISCRLHLIICLIYHQISSRIHQSNLTRSLRIGLYVDQHDKSTVAYWFTSVSRITFCMYAIQNWLLEEFCRVCKHNVIFDKLVNQYATVALPSWYTCGPIRWERVKETPQLFDVGYSQADIVLGIECHETQSF